MLFIYGHLKRWTGRLTGRLDQYQSAVTFAEAGNQQYARELVTPEKETESPPSKLLVVGRESTFSREIIDYALEMAQRLSYEIVALNTVPLSCETFNFFSSPSKKLCQEFREMSEENVKAFRTAAEKMDIQFSHVVKFIGPDEALEEMKREFRDIEFVISEAEEDQTSNRVEAGERARSDIYVYSMV